MPTEAQLPDDLRALAGRHALEIDNSRYAADMNRLVAALREAWGEPEPGLSQPTGGAHRVRRLALLAGVALALGGVVVLWPRGPSGDATPGGRSARLSGAASGASAALPTPHGSWQAEVTYDWPNAHYTERFEFRGDADELHGTASFLGVPRVVFEGRIEPDGLRFVTRTTEVGAGGSQDIVHRYQARWIGGELRVVMQTEGGSTLHAPVEFVARRAASASSPASR